MKLSVIVPIYNIEKYVEKCVKSILRQTFSDIEIILVDDGSKDLSGKICDQLAHETQNVIVIHKENGGLVSARKAGLQAASGEYITFVDGDDWISPDFYQNAFSINKNYDVLALAYVDEYEHCSIPQKNRINDGVFYRNDIQKNILSHLIYYNQMKEENVMFAPGLISGVVVKIVKREIALKTILKIDDTVSMGEDLVATALILNEAESLRIASNVNGYHYMRNEDSMTHLLNIEKGGRFETLYRFMIDNCAESVVEQLPLHALNVLYGNYRLAMGKNCKAPVLNRLKYVEGFVTQPYFMDVLNRSEEIGTLMHLDDKYIHFFRLLAKNRAIKVFIAYLMLRVHEKRG